MRKPFKEELEEHRKTFGKGLVGGYRIGKKIYIKAKPYGSKINKKIKIRANIVKKNIARTYGTPRYELRSVGLKDLGF